MNKKNIIPDRKTPPGINPVRNLNWYNPEKQFLDNGMNLYIFRDSTLDATQLNISFYGGTYTEQKPLAASTVIGTLQEGTKKHTAMEIARQFDFWGSYLKTSASNDNLDISLFFLNRYAHENLELITEIIREPCFPENEVAIYLNNRLEEWRIRQEQVAWLSRKHFLERIFGEKHPYGRSYQAKDFQTVQTDDLEQYYRLHLQPANGFCILSGNITATILNEVKNTLGSISMPASQRGRSIEAIPVQSSTPGIISIKKPNALQTAITVGKKLFNRNHRDYAGFQIMNTILGGYFGSRLMQNLRENKGLTYGIYSSLSSFRFDGLFSIQGEVDTAGRDTALQEIFYEIEQLRKEKVPDHELQLVKNYHMGNLLQAFDGVMNKADLTRSLLITYTPFDYFSRLTKEINAVTPEKIRSLAQKYLDPESLTVVTAGPK
ncbi:MAG: insulinase family protein [Chlorobi bacterium]|nr:insulinase family protein [Chlorobiota bacterium]